MKKAIVALLVLLAAGRATYAQTAVHQPYVQKSPNKITVTPINSAKLLKQVEQGLAYLIDVRTAEEFNADHLRYAQNIDIRSADFGTLTNKLNKDKPVYLYCRSGNRSGQATDSLVSLGYKQAYNIGALDTLKKRGFPVE